MNILERNEQKDFLALTLNTDELWVIRDALSVYANECQFMIDAFSALPIGETRLPVIRSRKAMAELFLKELPL